MKNLEDLLKEISDPRRKQGRRYQQSAILMIIILGMMNGADSERGISRFAENNKEELIKYLKIKGDKVPTRNILRATMARIDFEELSNIFKKWTKNNIKIKEKEWISIDGKALRGTLTNKHANSQNFKSLISAFVSFQKQVLAVAKIENKKESEIPAVQKLIKELNLKDAIFTIDALHCQKETTKIIDKSGNNYVIGVKKNQKNLYNQLKKTV